MTKYVFKPYNPNFPELFATEKTRIAAHSSVLLIIEHVGSTAVPGLGGKGIIDIAIAVQKDCMHIVAKELERLGYLFRKEWSTDERLFFRIDLPDAHEGAQRYHVHLTCAESDEWKNLIFFRDYLRTHPETAQEYALVKELAAQQAAYDALHTTEAEKEVGEKYRQLKETTIHNILKKR